jgi:hypothetical protein
VAAVGLAVSRRGSSEVARGSCRGWLLAALAILVVCWAPAVADQLAGRGNLGLVARAAVERKSSLGATVGARAVVHTIGLRPWWLTRPASPWERKLDVRRPASALASVSSVAMLAWLVLASVLALRRGRRELAAGAAVALVLCAAVFALASATPSPRMLAATLGYTLWWASPAGMFVWLIAAWSAVSLLRDSRLARTLRPAKLPPRTGRLRAARQPLAALAGIGAVALGAGAGVAAGEADERSPDFAPLGTINARLGAVPSGHTVLLSAHLDGVITPLRPEITFALRRRGVRALGVGAYFRLGHWYEKFSHPYDYVVWIYDRGPPPVPRARVIARVAVETPPRRHVVSVALAPARR